MTRYDHCGWPYALHVSRILKFNSIYSRSWDNLLKNFQNCWEAAGAMLRRPSAPQWISALQNIFGTFRIECENFWTFWKISIFHEKIMKIMQNHENHDKSWKIENYLKKSKKSWKIKIFHKVQKFLHSIWKVPKMFWHLEIHWGALGRRNIDHDYRWT